MSIPLTNGNFLKLMEEAKRIRYFLILILLEIKNSLKIINVNTPFK